MYHDGIADHVARLGADARLELDVLPKTKVWVERDGAARALLGEAPLATHNVHPGELVLSFETPGRVPTRLPLLVSRGETVKISVKPPTSVPKNMIYVPPGRFLFGSADDTDLRHGFLNAPPIHEVTTRGYLIGRYEVTFAEWIEFLDDLPPAERARRTPSSQAPQSGLSLMLVEVAPGEWQDRYRHTFDEDVHGGDGGSGSGRGRRADTCGPKLKPSHRWSGCRTRTHSSTRRGWTVPIGYRVHGCATSTSGNALHVVPMHGRFQTGMHLPQTTRTSMRRMAAYRWHSVRTRSGRTRSREVRLASRTWQVTSGNGPARSSMTRRL